MAVDRRKRILIYGDSNTWGQMNFDGRYPEEKQWCWILQDKLGDYYRVVQEGLPARVAGAFETKKPELNGRVSFEVAYRTALPLDFVIVALGTNDLKERYARSASQIVDDILWYKEKIKKIKDTMIVKVPKVIFIAPPNFVSKDEYFQADEVKRQEVIIGLRQKEQSVIAFNDLKLTDDGVHFSENAHQVVAEEIHKVIEERW